MLGVPNRPTAVVWQEGIQGLSLIERDDEVVVPWGSWTALNWIHDASYHETDPKTASAKNQTMWKSKGLLKGISADNQTRGWIWKNSNRLALPYGVPSRVGTDPSASVSGTPHLNSLHNVSFVKSVILGVQHSSRIARLKRQRPNGETQRAGAADAHERSKDHLDPPEMGLLLEAALCGQRVLSPFLL